MLEEYGCSFYETWDKGTFRMYQSGKNNIVKGKWKKFVHIQFTPLRTKHYRRLKVDLVCKNVESFILIYVFLF